MFTSSLQIVLVTFEARDSVLLAIVSPSPVGFYIFWFAWMNHWMIDKLSEITLGRSCQITLFNRPFLFTSMLMFEPLKEYPGGWKISPGAKWENLKAGRIPWCFQGGESCFPDSLLCVCMCVCIHPSFFTGFTQITENGKALILELELTAYQKA